MIIAFANVGCCVRRQFDLYPLESIDLAPNVHEPVDVPQIAMQAVMKWWSQCKNSSATVDVAVAPALKSGPFTDLCDAVTKTGKLSKNFPFDNTSYPADESKLVRQAYWAAISYTDAQIGKVLRALAEHGLQKSTVIALW